MKHYLGLDIGATHSKAGLMDEQGRMIDQFITPTRAEEQAESMFNDIINLLYQRQKNRHGFTLEGIGVGLPGVLNLEKSKIREASNLKRWVGFPLKEFLEAKTSARVVIENDASMAALGEYWAGAGKRYNSMLMLTLGSGIGGAIIHQGKILEWNGFSSEIGHMVINYNGPLCRCGKRGCLETYNGRYGLQRLQQEIVNRQNTTGHNELNEPLTPKQLSEKAINGDPVARQIFTEAGDALGIGISNILNLLRVDAIIIGGGIARAWPGMLDQAEKTMIDHTFQLEQNTKLIHPAELGESAGVIGAGWHIFRSSRNT
jgi:glucokinase